MGGRNFMKIITLPIIVIVFVFCLTGFVQASLIDDLVLVEHRFPDFNTPIEGESVTVQDGTTEIFGMQFSYDVNIEESSVIVDFTTTNQFTVRSYNGLVLSGLDFQEGYILLGVDVNTNMVGWDASRLVFDDHLAGFNWQGLTVDGTTDFTALFDFGPNPIPIPPTLILFVSGIAGFTLIRRKIKK
jgi:hypothetical protein